MEQRDPDVEKLIEAANKAGVRPDCPACPNKTTGAAQHVIHLPASGVAEGFRALGLVCERCGFVSLFMASVLGQYMDPRDASN
jgi:hypothetical protein